MELKLFDLIIVAIFSGSTFLGLYQGFILSFINIIAFITTIILTIFLIPLSKEIIIEYLSNEILVTILSVVVSYLISSFSCNWIVAKVKEATKDRFQGLVDRLAGSWLGAVRGFILCLTLFIVAIILTTSSYVGAKDLWVIISTPSEKDYPRWLKKSATIDITQNSYIFFRTLLERSWAEAALKEIKLPAKEAPKISTEEILKQAQEIKRELEDKTPSTETDLDNIPQPKAEALSKKSIGNSIFKELENLLQDN